MKKGLKSMKKTILATLTIPISAAFLLALTSVAFAEHSSDADATMKDCVQTEEQHQLHNHKCEKSHQPHQHFAGDTHSRHGHKFTEEHNSYNAEGSHHGLVSGEQFLEYRGR